MKKRLRILAGGMLLAAAVFVWYALGHPEAFFPWENTVTIGAYAVWLLVMAGLFAASFRKK